MKQQYFKFLVFGLLLSCCVYKASAQDIQVVASLDNSTLKIGDQTKLNFNVHQPAKARVNFPQITDSIGSKVQILATSKLDTIFDKTDHNNITVHRAYTITAFDSGTYPIPEFDFGSANGVLKSNELHLVVQTITVDTTKAIYDIKQPLAVSYTFWDWLRDHWVPVAIVFAVILIIIAIIWYLKTRPKKEKVIVEVKPDVPFHIQILNRLQELRGKKLYQQDVKAYHSELTDIIRDYLERRYVIKSHEKTSDEIFDSLKFMDIDQESRNLLRQLLLQADMVKFAKEKPSPSENEQSMDNAIAFVNKTRQVFTQPLPTEGGGNDAHV
ncbi:MAG: hypothetical protein V4592_11830 [Bacteroidota bacterium]